jgi:antitoxin component of RelBE/YafQ-DinJ toxin-antitoxin module
MGGPKKPTATRKVSVLKLRVTEEYEEWVKKVADHMGIDISTLLDMGVTKVARDIRFPIPPPPR